MSRGSTWSSKGTRYLIDIWADSHISQLLEKTHKNADVLSKFSERMKEKGEKGITATDPEPNGPTDTPLTTCKEDSDTRPSCDEQNGESNGRLAIPGAQARKHLGRKRKAKDHQADGLQAYMAQQSKQLQDMYEAEQKRQAQENTVLENLLRAHQEAEERRFQAMQAQQEANRHMFTQLMATVANALSSGQSQHTTLASSNPLCSSSSSEFKPCQCLVHSSATQGPTAAYGHTR
ncbi:hypothetical protein Q8A67_006352 [Cirrhinus molitorella]|uniref:Uncharacterized protein n=1 Tax=Cirrhinus molitorella TaxID=172907 RepID=A0AA88Q4X1_9TELE|nr:hypothetical protein Q8A67_006352 [Cirrhinus molitorella]